MKGQHTQLTFDGDEQVDPELVKGFELERHALTGERIDDGPRQLGEQEFELECTLEVPEKVVVCPNCNEVSYQLDTTLLRRIFGGTESQTCRNCGFPLELCESD